MGAVKPNSLYGTFVQGLHAVDVKRSKTINRPGVVHFQYLLRPKLEYACPVWHGGLLERDAIALERV